VAGASGGKRALRHNNGMHPTANSVAFIINHPARRVMPSVMLLTLNFSDKADYILRYGRRF
jgi:hypothetical protein